MKYKITMELEFEPDADPAHLERLMRWNLEPMTTQTRDVEPSSLLIKGTFELERVDG